MVKDETFAQTQPRLNLATFVTTYMDEYATKLMNEAININYIDETEYFSFCISFSEIQIFHINKFFKGLGGGAFPRRISHNNGVCG